ncbi:ComF family protein [Aeromicrobium sp. CF4.19]|uniref:ComF family protein n=1 Tax=Aeromicrobium sp. CF4.19 TaxID=3373082 RepID=UPI003EE4941E
MAPAPDPARLSWRLAAADLVLGAVCVGCGEPARGVCPGCRPGLEPEPEVVLHEPVPVVAAASHDGLARDVVVAWKERSVRVLLEPLALLLAASVCLAADPRRPVCLVPVPATRRSRRRRGADVVAVLATHAARRLEEVGVEVTTCNALRVSGRPVDQSGLDARARRLNVAGAFAVRRAVPVGPQVVVVDDVVTTGATLAEAVAVLARTGPSAVGAATVTARR